MLKTTFKALRNVSLCPWKIVAAVLVLLHIEHHWTTWSLGATDGYAEGLAVLGDLDEPSRGR